MCPRPTHSSAQRNLLLRRAEILDEWEKRAREQVPVARKKSDATLDDHLPLFLDAIALALERGSHCEPKAACAINDSCILHAEQRSRTKVYTVGAVLKEYELLHETILDLMEEDTPLTRLETKIIRASIHAAIQTAAATFRERERETLRESEEWLRATLTCIGEAVIATAADDEGSIVFMNPPAERLAGWTLAEAKGVAFTRVFTLHPFSGRMAEKGKGEKSSGNAHGKIEEHDVVARVLHENQDEAIAAQARLRSRTGDDLLLQISASPVRDAKRKLSGVVVVLRDITAAQSLREGTALLARVVELVPAFVGIARPDGRGTFVNAFGRHLVGLKAEDVTQTSVGDYFAPTETERLREEVFPRILEGHWQGEVLFRHFGSGEPVPVEWNAFRVRDEESGEVKALACVAIDLREREKIEAKRRDVMHLAEIERARLLNLFLLAPMPICVLEGPDHVYTLVNPAYVKLLQGTADFVGKRAQDVTPEAESHGFLTLLDGVYRSARAFHGVEVPLELTDDDGKKRTMILDFVYQPILDEVGMSRGILVVAHDVTQKVQAVKRVRESEELFRQLADSMPQLVWTADGQGRIEFVNRVFCDYTGLSETEIRHWESGTLLHPEDYARALVTWNEAVANGIEYNQETRFHRADGTFRWMLVRALPSHDERGEAVKWFGSCTDIHDQKLISLELEEARVAAENATRAKSAFLANMSHEIRTPLGAILGFSEFLTDPDQTPSDRHECITRIRRNAVQLSRLINELLDLSKIEAGRLEIETVPFHLDEVVRDVDDLLSFQAAEKGIGLRFLSVGPVRRTLRSDPTRLRQILLNVVGNAIKFTQRGGVEVRISTLPPTREGDPMRLSFAVRDTGIGLSPEQALRIWEPFVQGDSSTTRQFGGTGLGLSFSKRLAHALGGDLTLTRSEPNAGSEFTIFIATGESAAESFLPELSEPLPEREAFSSGTQGLRGTRVLLVEDSPDNQALVKRLLTREGAEVRIASDGVEGVRMALADSFDLVLMDVQMPLLDGFAATSELRGRGLRIPIVALTAHAMKGDKERALAHGFDDHLTKPIDRRALLEKVISLVGRKREHARADEDLMALDPALAALLARYRDVGFPEALKSLRAAMAARDAAEVARLAHIVMGSTGCYVWPGLGGVAARLEAEAKGSARPEMLASLLEELEAFSRG